MGRRRCCCEGCWEATDTFDELNRTDWTYAGSIESSGSDQEWQATGEADSAEDEVFSYVDLTTGQQSDYLVAYNFGFALPSGHTINGAEVKIIRKASPHDSITEETIMLGWRGGTTSDNKANSSNIWTSYTSEGVYGSNSDVWGIASGDVNDSDFGVFIRVQPSESAATAHIDAVAVRLHYYGCGGIPDGWGVCSGSWELKDYNPAAGVYNCVLVSTSAGKIAWRKDTGGSPRVGVIQFDIKPNLDAGGTPKSALEDGGHIRVYAFQDSSCAGDWIAADLQMAASGATILGTLSLVNSAGDLDTSGSQDVTITTGTTLYMCVGSNSVGARLSASTYPVRACHDETWEDPYFVISNESSSIHATFDNFEQTDHYDHDTDCPACYCSCDGNCVPLDLVLTINDDTAGYGGCANKDGTELTMSRTTPCQWESASLTCPTTPSVNRGNFELVPPYAGGIGGELTATDYTLSWYDSGGSLVETMTPNANSTCDPLYLEYDSTTFTEAYNSRCCDGVGYAYDPGTCPDGSSPETVGAPTSLWWCKGHWFITITEAVP